MINSNLIFINARIQSIVDLCNIISHYSLRFFVLRFAFIKMRKIFFSCHYLILRFSKCANIFFTSKHHICHWFNHHFFNSKSCAKSCEFLKHAKIFFSRQNQLSTHLTSTSFFQRKINCFQLIIFEFAEAYKQFLTTIDHCFFFFARLNIQFHSFSKNFKLISHANYSSFHFFE